MKTALGSPNQDRRFVGSGPLLLRKWEGDMSFSQENLSTVPIWVKLPGLRRQLVDAQHH